MDKKCFKYRVTLSMHLRLDIVSAVIATLLASKYTFLYICEHCANLDKIRLNIFLNYCYMQIRSMFLIFIIKLNKNNKLSE